MKVETRTMHEPTGTSKTRETMRPETHVTAPITGETHDFLHVVEILEG